MRFRALAAFGAAAVAGMCAFVAASGPAAAKGGGVSAVEPGTTIYFDYNTGGGGVQAKMNPDGTGKTTLPSGVFGPPSRALHGGQRWFLQWRNVGGTYADGRNLRAELFAINESGTTSVQVTNNADILPDHTGTQVQNAGAGWSWYEISWAGQGDENISYAGYTLNPDRKAATWGIWNFGVSWTTGVPVATTAPALIPNAVAGSLSHDNGPGYYQRLHWVWSPDASELMYSAFNGSDWEIWHAVPDVNGSGTTQTRISDGTAPHTGFVCSWSSTGRIAYSRTVSGLCFEILAMNSDGSNVTTIVPTPGKGFVEWARWSPSGSFLAYMYDDGRGNDDVHRIAANGTGDVSLTADLKGYAAPFDWR
jgi:hypothetical protein